MISCSNGDYPSLGDPNPPSSITRCHGDVVMAILILVGWVRRHWLRSGDVYRNRTHAPLTLIIFDRQGEGGEIK